MNCILCAALRAVVLSFALAVATGVASAQETGRLYYAQSSANVRWDSFTTSERGEVVPMPENGRSAEQKLPLAAGTSVVQFQQTPSTPVLPTGGTGDRGLPTIFSEQPPSRIYGGAEYLLWWVKGA